MATKDETIEKVEETYSAIKDPKSFINDWWGQHDITARGTVIIMLLIWVGVVISSIYGFNVAPILLESVYNMTLTVVAVVLVGVQGLKIIGETIMKVKGK